MFLCVLIVEMVHGDEINQLYVNIKQLFSKSKIIFPKLYSTQQFRSTNQISYILIHY